MSVNGKVTDKTSQDPLPGVNVILKGTSNGVITDFDGLYSISNVKSGDVLVFSFIGYNPKEITITTQTEVNVELEE